MPRELRDILDQVPPDRVGNLPRKEVPLQEILKFSSEVFKFVSEIRKVLPVTDVVTKRDSLVKIQTAIEMRLGEIAADIQDIQELSIPGKVPTGVSEADYIQSLLELQGDINFVLAEFLIPNLNEIPDPAIVPEAKEKGSERPLFDLMVEKLREVYPDLPDHTKGEIVFATATPLELKAYTEHVTTALLRQVRKELLAATVTSEYPVGEMNVLGSRLFGVDSKSNSNPTLKDFLDQLPPEVSLPYKDQIQTRFLVIQMHHNRAYKFNAVFTTEDEKSISSITNVYASMGNDNGGYRPYDLGGLNSRDLPSSVSGKGGLGTEDEFWQLGAVSNHVIAQVAELIKEDPSLSPFPWSEKAGSRKKIESKIRESLAKVVPPISQDQIDMGIYIGFWDIRSAGIEFLYDEKGVDQRFSRLMNIRKWISSANGAAAKRAYEYTDELGKVFDRMMVTQEEFIHATVMLPQGALEYGAVSSLSTSEQNDLKARYSKGADIDSKVFVVRIKPQYQQWKGSARNGSWIVVPKNHVNKDLDPTTDQVMLQLSEIRKSNVDLNLIDWGTLTTAANSKYAFIANKMEAWFENYGTITKKDAGKKFFADIRSMQGHDFVPIEKAVVFFRERRISFVQQKLGFAQGRTLIGLGRSWQHGNTYTTDDGVVMNERSPEAVKQTKFLSSMVHVAKLDNRDFDQWGFKAFFHSPNDYLVNKMKKSGGRFRTRLSDGSIGYTEELETLETLRDMLRTRSGKYLQIIIDDALDVFESGNAVLINPNSTPQQIKVAEGSRSKAINQIQVELFKVAINLFLERYVFSEMETFKIGSAAEIETKSGRDPLDFIDIQTFVSSVEQYCIDLRHTMGKNIPDNFPNRKYILDLMVEKGIMGTDQSVQIDLIAVSTGRWAKIPTRGKRQLDDAKPSH